MSKIEYVGRKAYYIGKSLPQICLKLKNFGIGRMFIREKYNKFPETTYFVLTNIEPDMSDPYLRKGKFYANVVFRGVQHGKQEILGGQEDYQLVAKEDEKHYLEKTLPIGKTRFDQIRILPKFIDMPPLMKTMFLNEANERKLNINENDIKLPLVIIEQPSNNIRQE